MIGPAVATSESPSVVRNTAPVEAPGWELPTVRLGCGYFEWPHGGASTRRCRLSLEQGGASGEYNGLQLASAFQPMVAAATGQVVAFEALLRARDRRGRPLAPPEVFQLPRTRPEQAYLDQLSRTLHAVNFALQAEADELLFLNIDGRHLLDQGRDHLAGSFERLLRHCGVNPERVVLEILESAAVSADALVPAVAAWRQRGFRIALDDFGSQHSNLDRLLALTPEVVKLERSLIRQAIVQPAVRRSLPKLVEILHDLGARVVCEGIETAEDSVVAREAGVDLLQGYFLGRPEPRCRRTLPPVAAWR